MLCNLTYEVKSDVFALIFRCPAFNLKGMASMHGQFRFDWQGCRRKWGVQHPNVSCKGLHVGSVNLPEFIAASGTKGSCDKHLVVIKTEISV